ncbi:hypothetical protein L1887_38981 [Cichorium endivia]|nr:hypothetical protein L1887_38981 [Cichorium endivia]
MHRPNRSPSNIVPNSSPSPHPLLLQLHHRFHHHFPPILLRHDSQCALKHLAYRFDILLFKLTQVKECVRDYTNL